LSDQAAPVLEGARAILETWPESKTLGEAVAQVERFLGEKSDAAIDASKCLLEALCKTILLERGDKAEAFPKLQPLLKQTCAALGLVEADGGESVRNMVSGMATAIQALSEFRNQFGPLGHGKDAYHVAADDWQRTIAVRTAEAICVLLHESYRRLPAIDQHSRRPFMQDPLIHDDMDHITEVSVDEETNTISINGVILRPSQLLWDYDRIGYIEQKRLAEGSAAEIAGFDILRQYEPSKWPGQHIVEQDNMGDWGGWLSQFDGPLQTMFDDGTDEGTALAAGMASAYIEECRSTGYPLPSEFRDDMDVATAEAEDRSAIAAEFRLFLQAWKAAWRKSRHRN
jgi:hypothetical protein